MFVCRPCGRYVPNEQDFRGCADEPICWHCLYEQRGELLAVCEKLDAFVRSDYRQGVGEEIMSQIRAAITAAKGGNSGQSRL